MILKRFGAFAATGVLGGVMVVAGPGLAAAGSPGMVDSSGKTVKALVKDLGLTVPARCVVAQQTRSDRSWAAYSLKSGPGCNPGEGYAVVQRSGGTWNALPIGGSYVTCSDLKSKLTKAGAPTSVFRDFKAGQYCVKGE
jgi:hypothetical protein